MNTIILGNVLALLACILMAAIGLIRQKKNILAAQCAQFALCGVSNAILGGWSGVISNGLSIVRNLLCIRREITLWERLIFIAAQIVLSVLIHTVGLIGWAPVFAACAYTFVLSSKNAVVIKSVMIFGQIMWALYDFSICNYVGAVFDVITIVTNVVGIVMLLRKSAGTKAEQ